MQALNKGTHRIDLAILQACNIGGNFMDITFKPYTLNTQPSIKRMAVIVTTQKGYCYWLNSAEPFPTEQEAAELWKYDRKSFLPYFGQAGY